MIILATLFLWIGAGLGLLGIGLGVALLLQTAKNAPCGREDRGGFHFSRTDADTNP